MATTKIKPIKTTVKKAIDYICNPLKTEDSLLVSSFGCSPETADIEFEFTRDKSRGWGDNLAYHLIQSFAIDDNISPETVHKLGIEFADKVLKGQHEYVITTHVDKGHIHNHIIFNSVNYVTHNKYHDCKQTYKNIRSISDNFCREYGTSVIENERGVRGKGAWEYKQDKAGTSWKTKLKESIDDAILESNSWEKFLTKMQEKGYEIKEGKHVSFKAPDQERATRAKRIGDFYTEEKIKERIENKEMYKDFNIENKTEDKTNIHSRTVPKVSVKAINPNKINLIRNLQENIKCQENGGYKYRMEINNLKEMSKTLNFLICNNMKNADEFLEKYGEIKSTYTSQKNSIIELEKRMGTLSENTKYVMNYKKYKYIYNKARFDTTGKYLKEHEKEIIIFEASKKYVAANKIDVQVFDVGKMLKNYKSMEAKRDLLYKDYSISKNKLKEYNIIKKNVESILKNQLEQDGEKERSSDHIDQTKKGNSEKDF